MDIWPYNGKLIIFTTFYRMQGYAPYIKSLATTIGLLDKLNIRNDYWVRMGDFHVERAINDTLTKFIQDKEATDLLMIDSDLEWKAEDVVRLLVHPEEIVGATYRMTNKWSDYVGHIISEGNTPRGKVLTDGTNLIRADRLAAGFIRFKKTALQKYHDYYKDLRCKEPDGEMTIFYERFLHDGVMMSQDMAFSKRCIDMGLEMWLDPHISLGHYGITGYLGNYHQYLLDKKTVSDAEPAFKAIERMAAEIKERKVA